MSDPCMMTIRVHGRDFPQYVHDGGGVETNIRQAILEHGWLTLRAWARGLRLVDPESQPTDMDVQRFLGYADIGISNKGLTDWYCLLRRTQGDLPATLYVGVIPDGSAVRDANPWIRYNYVIDLDEGKVTEHARPPYVGGPFPAFQLVGEWR